ncbi:hypothetical protein IT568_01700 [bacterium]|nr:hypothetical protein [bacterium]
MEELKIFIEQTLSEKNFYLMKLSFNSKNKKLEVLIDSEKGVMLGDCTELSKKISVFLDENESLTDGNYNLEVSSAGIDFPLSKAFQFTKNIGRKAKLRYKDGEKEVSVEKAKILGIAENIISFQTKEEFNVNLDKIIEAKIILEF